MGIYWNRRTYTEQEFRNAWKNSASIAECARALNLTIFGGTYATLKSTAEALELNQEHFTGKGWRKGLSTPAGKGMTRPIEYYLVENLKSSSHGLKGRLIKEGYLVATCSAPFCPVPNPTVNPFTGEEKELKLALDHINGVNTDNRLENLRLLCYHCHGETTTFAGSNQKRKKVVRNTERGQRVKVESKYFCACGNDMSYRAKQCGDCYKQNRNDKKKLTLTVEDILQRLAADSNYEEIGRESGVSGNAIRAMLKRNGIVPPKSRFSSKNKEN